MKLRRALLKDQVTVTPYAGETAYGPDYDEAVTLWCNVTTRSRLVKTQGGDEVVSEVTLQLHPRSRVVDSLQLVDPLPLFVPESQVTVRGVPARVVSTQAHTLRGRTTHVEVLLA